MYMQGFCFVLVWFLFLPFTFTLTNTKIHLREKTEDYLENLLGIQYIPKPPTELIRCVTNMCRNDELSWTMS